MKKHIIWSNNIDLNDWASYLEEELSNKIMKGKKEEGEKFSEVEKYELVCNLNDEYFEDEKINLNQPLPNRIVAIANLGLWNGRKTGYKILGDNLNEILQGFGCDFIEVYSDGYNIKFKGVHHDGKNYMEFRLIKNTENIDNLLNDIYEGKEISRSKLSYYTSSLLPYVAKFYGW